MRLRQSFAIVLALLFSISLSASADKVPSRRSKSKSAKVVKPVEKEPETAPENPDEWWPKSAQVGPAQVKLLEQAMMDLPAGFIYMNQSETTALLERLGNRPDSRTVGGVFPKNISDAKYFFIVEWEAVGYVKDDDADKLDAKEILQSIREGTEEGNKFREEKGLPPVSVVGWDEPPRYDKERRHMVWAIRGKSVKGETVNFNTRLLGRGGFLALNLICGPEQLAALKPTVEDLLKRTQYNPGQRYADFVKGKDKVAEFGLAALVIGGAALAGKAVKIGLLAKFGKLLLGLLLALKKALILLLFAIGAFVKRLFGGKNAAPQPPTDASTTPSASESSAAAKDGEPSEEAQPESVAPPVLPPHSPSQDPEPPK